ncbi:protein phosphatase CheZ [Vreelandella massiliensis]|uniref:protein phosphatase CheZ n=1 Tax=Vreelandella massiliensis TaxID=1816686 RepID=UPI00096A81F0|nr:protein phosphatase CheZ [Halomonas massiliensis]MYL22656.1 protein phosphatase CheZ [Halomonas alkaliantarctica]
MANPKNAHDSAMPSVLNEHGAEEVIQRIGHLTRMLRESMKELGLDQQIEQAAQAIPDASERLRYVASMTEQAAERSLNAVERAQPTQDQLESESQTLSKRWEALENHDDPLSNEQLIADTRHFLAEQVPSQVGIAQKELLEVMMAQDFQDLTGQVIKKMMDVIQTIEQELVQVLMESAPGVTEGVNLKDERDEHAKLRNGPQMDKEKADVVSGQDQVDDLLDELGF